MKKLLHERLREHDNGTGRISIVSSKYEITLRDHEAKALADEIERYYIPRPRFEDGEIVTVENRDEIAWDDGGKWLMTAISNDGIPMATFANRESSVAEMTPDGFVKRLMPKAIDADGVEINAGDTVWSLCNGEKYIVTRICDSGTVIVSSTKTGRALGGFDADRLTHKEPDSLEKLRADIQEFFTNGRLDYAEIGEWIGRIDDFIKKDKDDE